MDNIDRAYANEPVLDSHPANVIEAGAEKNAELSKSTVAKEERHVVTRWLLHDTPYIAMLLLALAGVMFQLAVTYWIVMIPVFAVLSIAAGWKNFKTKTEQFGLVYRQALDWCALLVALYLLFNGGVQGVMNATATSLAMMTLLALGTFVAGVQARVWQISIVGTILFLAVPGFGWLAQSPLLLTAAAIVIVVLSGLAWWVSHKWPAPDASALPGKRTS